MITQNVFPLFLQFGFNDLLCAGRRRLSREIDVDRKVSWLLLDTVKKASSHHRLWDTVTLLTHYLLIFIWPAKPNFREIQPLFKKVTWKFCQDLWRFSNKTVFIPWISRSSVTEIVILMIDNRFYPWLFLMYSYVSFTCDLKEPCIQLANSGKTV